MGAGSSSPSVSSGVLGSIAGVGVEEIDGGVGVAAVADADSLNLAQDSPGPPVILGAVDSVGPVGDGADGVYQALRAEPINEFPQLTRSQLQRLLSSTHQLDNADGTEVPFDFDLSFMPYQMERMTARATTMPRPSHTRAAVFVKNPFAVGKDALRLSVRTKSRRSSAQPGDNDEATEKDSINVSEGQQSSELVLGFQLDYIAELCPELEVFWLANESPQHDFVWNCQRKSVKKMLSTCETRDEKSLSEVTKEGIDIKGGDQANFSQHAPHPRLTSRHSLPWPPPNRRKIASTSIPATTSAFLSPLLASIVGGSSAASALPSATAHTTPCPTIATPLPAPRSPLLRPVNTANFLQQNSQTLTFDLPTADALPLYYLSDSDLSAVPTQGYYPLVIRLCTTDPTRTEKDSLQSVKQQMLDNATSRKPSEDLKEVRVEKKSPLVTNTERTDKSTNSLMSAFTLGLPSASSPKSSSPKSSSATAISNSTSPNTALSSASGSPSAVRSAPASATAARTSSTSSPASDSTSSGGHASALTSYFTLVRNKVDGSLTARLISQRVKFDGRIYDLLDIFGLDETPQPAGESDQRDYEEQTHMESDGNYFLDNSTAPGAAKEVNTEEKSAVYSQLWKDSTKLLGTASSISSTSSSALLSSSSTRSLDGNECIICLSAPRDSVIYPCRHLSMCSACSEILVQQAKRVCPVCRTHITSVIHLPNNCIQRRNRSDITPHTALTS